MIKRMLAVIVAALVMSGTAAGGEYVTQMTQQAPYELLRAEGNEDAATLAACFDLTTAGDFASKDANAVDLKPTDAGTAVQNELEFIFCGGAAADKTFSWALYAWRTDNGPCRLIAYGTGTLGTQAVVKYPHNGATATNKFWADTLVITAQYGPKTLYVPTAGGNSVVSLNGDWGGNRWEMVKIYNASGSGAEAGAISVYKSYL